MPITKTKKDEIFGKIKDAAKVAKSIVFVKFNGLPVADTTAMRKELREKNIKYYVAKKTITAKALDEGKFEGALPELPGEIALAWGDDLIAPAREVYAFAKIYPEKVSIVGGVFEGKFMAQSEMMEIATIPGMQTLYAQFVNVINSPIQKLVVALDAIAAKKA